MKKVRRVRGGLAQRISDASEPFPLTPLGRDIAKSA